MQSWSSGFTARSERSLERTGRANAAASSRVTAALLESVDTADDDGRSVAVSIAPSLHPSLGSVRSMACSESTIGAGDNTAYWDFSHRLVEVKDLGHTCRECRLPFTALKEPLTERRGARTSARYHAACFSGFADPRSQASSSHHLGRHAYSQLAAAPTEMAGSKMRTASHFGEGASSRGARGGGGSSGSGGGKIAAFLGGNSFGAASSKGLMGAEAAADGEADASRAALSAAVEASERERDASAAAAGGGAAGMASATKAPAEPPAAGALESSVGRGAPPSRLPSIREG